MRLYLIAVVVAVAAMGAAGADSLAPTGLDSVQSVLDSQPGLSPATHVLCACHPPDRKVDWVALAALAVSVFALGFTILSFWWMNARRGKIVLGAPRTYSLLWKGKTGLLELQLPLIFFNTGAPAQIVWNLRAWFEREEDRSATLFFNEMATKLGAPGDKPGSRAEGQRSWAQQFALSGRGTYSGVFVFFRTKGDFEFTGPKSTLVVEGKLNQATTWTRLLTYDIVTPSQVITGLGSGKRIVYDSDADRYDEVGDV